MVDLFLKRIKETLINFFGLAIMLVILALVSTVVTLIVASLILIIPVYLLSFAIADYAVIWIVIVFMGVIAWSYWDSLSKWINWQFIEPFKKNSK